MALGRLGWPLRRIEEATGVRRETISAYLKAAGIAVRGRGRPGERPAKPAISPPGVSTDPPAPAAVEPPPERAPSASACEPYRTFIEEALGRGRNAMAIWQDLVDDHGFTARYASVKRFVAVLRTQTSPEARVVITTAPGEEAQVDYGDGPMVRDPATGKYRRTRLFVLTLGYSRKSVRLLTWRSSTQIWAELHEAAFRRLGGTVRVDRPRQPARGRAHARTSTTRRSIRSTATSSPITASSPCRAASAIPIARAKSKPASATRRRRR